MNICTRLPTRSSILSVGISGLTERRCAEIRGRLTEIGKKGLRLQRFVEKLNGEAQAPEARTVASPLAIHSAPTDKLKRRRLSY